MFMKTRTKYYTTKSASPRALLIRQLVVVAQRNTKRRDAMQRDVKTLYKKNVVPSSFTQKGVLQFGRVKTTIIVHANKIDSCADNYCSNSLGLFTKLRTEAFLVPCDPPQRVNTYCAMRVPILHLCVDNNEHFSTNGIQYG